MRPPFNLEAIDAQTGPVMAAGHRIFQTHKYADTDAGQVAYLLEQFQVPPGALVLDAGCGVGEVARLMAAQRPDLAFILMNVSQLQLSHCPVGEQFFPALDDCHHCRLPNEFVDAAMYSSALCQMDTMVALCEARRVMKQGGVLLINDMVRTKGTVDEMEQAMAARVLTRNELVDTIATAGFIVTSIDFPPYSAAHFEDMLEQEGIAHLLDGIVPIVIRAVAMPLNKGGE